jgi:hypothetical protein
LEHRAKATGRMGSNGDALEAATLGTKSGMGTGIYLRDTPLRRLRKMSTHAASVPPCFYGKGDGRQTESRAIKLPWT